MIPQCQENTTSTNLLSQGTCQVGRGHFLNTTNCLAFSLHSNINKRSKIKECVYSGGLIVLFQGALIYNLPSVCVCVFFFLQGSWVVEHQSF